MLPEKDQATAMGNMHNNWVKFGCVVFKLCEYDRQTDILITMLHIPPRGKVIDGKTVLYSSVLLHTKCMNG